MSVKKHLSNESRLQILEDYLGSDQSKKAIARKYGIAPGSLSDWLRIFGLKDKEYVTIMKSRITEEETISRSALEEIEALKQENARLQAQLKREELGHKLFKKMVELAEEKYKIPILKNSETK